MKTKNHAVITDSSQWEHLIPCDYLAHEGEFVLLMEDLTTPSSNKTEVLAYFYKPIKAQLIKVAQ